MTSRLTFSRLTGVIGTGTARHEKQHKPVLLLAVLGRSASGQASPGHIPWSRSLRDRFIDPTNGLAICKNHHWAMDRDLIAPCPDGLWKVSARIIPHRSPGEKDLADLAGKPVIPPNDPAFAPAKEATPGDTRGWLGETYPMAFGCPGIHPCEFPGENFQTLPPD